MRPGRPKAGQRVQTKPLKARLPASAAELVARRGGSGYLRQLVAKDSDREQPVRIAYSRSPRMKVVEVNLPADLHARVLALGGSGYLRHLVLEDSRSP